MEPNVASSPLAMLLAHYQPEGEAETADVPRVRALAKAADDPWRRELPLHVTASALIVHPSSARVLLRWHQRQQAWLQVGGHGDPGESDPLAIALREAAEETGLADLVPWPDSQLRHLVIVDVPAGKGEPAHEHADLRYFMATRTPEAARAENDDAPLRWLSLTEAYEATSEVNLTETLARLERLLAGDIGAKGDGWLRLVDSCVFEALTPDVRYFETVGEQRICFMHNQPYGDSALTWHKSSASTGDGECIEVARWKLSVLVRDSGDQSGPVLAFTSAQWRGLVRRIKNDEAVRH